MSKKFSAFVAKVSQLTTFLTVLLFPVIAMAEEKGKKEGDFSFSLFGPFAGIAKTIWGWLEPFLKLDTEWEYWWIIIFTIPLTFFWQWKAGRKVQKTFNDIGGYVLCGGLALAVVLIPLGIISRALWPIVRILMDALGFSLNPSISGFFSLIWLLLSNILLFLFLWILGKLGLKGVIVSVLKWFAEQARKIWEHRKVVIENPTLKWTIAGGLIVTLLINGEFAIHVTKDFAFSGLIPIISGSVGVVFFFYRTVLGNDIKNKMLKQAPPGWWYCDLVADKPLYVEKLWETQGVLQPILNADGSQKWEKNHKCGARNRPEYETCCRPYCNNTPGWICPKCSYKGEDVVIAESPPEKEGGKPKKETIKQGISWKVKNCPKCHTAQPARPKQFHFPIHDLFTAPEGVLPTDDSSAAPTAAGSAAAAPAAAATGPAAPAAEAGCWIECSCGEMNFLHKTPQYCDFCGVQLRAVVPTGEAKGEDDLPNCSAPSFREMWWDIP